MSDLIRFAVARRTARASLHGAWLDGGTLTLYDGPEPATADTALTAQTALATFALPDPCGTATDGVLTVGAIAAVMVAATGTPAFARARSAYDSVVGDYSVGGVGSGQAVELDNLSLVEGGYATVVSFVVTEG